MINVDTLQPNFLPSLDSLYFVYNLHYCLSFGDLCKYFLSSNKNTWDNSHEKFGTNFFQNKILRINTTFKHCKIERKKYYTFLWSFAHFLLLFVWSSAWTIANNNISVKKTISQFLNIFTAIFFSNLKLLHKFAYFYMKY